VDHDALHRRLIEIHNAQAWDRLGEVFTEDVVEEYPQSGEVFQGLANIQAVRANYPRLREMTGTVDSATAALAATDEKWVMTPLYTAIRLEGSGDMATAVHRITYPDRSRWWNVSIYRLRGGRIAHVFAYFAPEFEAPDWRAPYRSAP
jgi:hypothetical protein